VDERDIFVLADQALLRVVEQIGDDQWDQTLPEWFQLGGGQENATVREIVNYHAYDDSWVPDMLAGKTMDAAGNQKHKGDLLGEDPKAAFAAIVEKACAAAMALDDLDQPAHLSFGEYTAREYLWQVTSFRGLRAHDIAKVIGADTQLPAALVQGMWDEIVPHVEEWRAIGVYPAAVQAPDNADLQDKLLALTGREPDGRTE